MTKPDKDDVLETSEQTNPGGSSSPSSFGAAANNNPNFAGDSKASPASGAKKDSDGFDVACEDQGNNPASSGEGSLNDDESRNPEETADEAVAKAQAEMQEWKDKYMRLHAEWDTYRRRTAEQRQEERTTATEKLVENLLPVIDDFERTIDYAEKNGEVGLLDGVKAVKTKLVDTLKKEGVEVIDPQGEAFDALKCQAINTCENKEVPDETVAEVYQKGYKMGKKVLRPAMVTVAIGGPKREVPQDSDDE